jgi:cytochrome o ubiquinol oxidase operon protein cyoD
MNTTHGSLSSYIVGFVLSACLTFAAFWVAPLLGAFAYPAIIIAALIQLLVQIIFFLDLGSEPRPHWHLLVFVFTGIIIGIVVVGTLWIMSNLDHMHMHSPTTTDIYEGGVVAPQNELH